MKARDRVLMLQQRRVGGNVLLGPGEWAVVWTEGPPRRIECIPRAHSTPAWAEHRWTPDQAHPLTEGTMCRGVLQTFVRHGWEPDQIDDALGQSVEAWARNPMRLPRAGGSNELVVSYHALRAHLSKGLPLRFAPIRTVEIVYEAFGAVLWEHVVALEIQKMGPFPAEWNELIGDLWRGGVGAPSKAEIPMPELNPTKETVAVKPAADPVVH